MPTSPDKTAPSGKNAVADVGRRLAALPPLAVLSAAGQASLAEIGAPRWYRDGEVVLDEGESASRFYAVLHGRVRMQRTLPNGRTVVLALFHPGDVFGTVSALGGQRCDAAVVATERTLCLTVRNQDLFTLFERQPELVREILPVLTRQLVECRDCIIELTCYRVEIRLAQLLAKLADNVGQACDGGTFIPVPLSRQELADMTGTTIETAIRIMSRWQKDGVVRTSRQGFLVQDRAALDGLTGAETL